MPEPYLTPDDCDEECPYCTGESCWWCWQLPALTVADECRHDGPERHPCHGETPNPPMDDLDLRRARERGELV